MANLINEAQRMQQLAGILTESQLEEALNKDIRQKKIQRKLVYMLC